MYIKDLLSNDFDKELKNGCIQNWEAYLLEKVIQHMFFETEIRCLKISVDAKRQCIVFESTSEFSTPMVIEFDVYDNGFNRIGHHTKVIGTLDS